MIKTVRKYFCYLTFSLVCTFSVSAADTPTETIHAFLKLIEKNKSTEAIEKYITPKVLEMMGTQKQATIAQMQTWNASFGESQGFEKLFSEVVSTKIEHHVYVMYYPGLPVSYNFYLYKTTDGWMIVKFNYKTDLNNIGKVVYFD